MLKKNNLIALAVLTVLTYGAAADEDTATPIVGTITIEVDGKKEQIAINGSEVIHIDEIATRVKNAVKDTGKKKHEGLAIFGHGVVLDGSGAKTIFRLDDSDDVHRVLPGAVRMQIEKATKGAVNNRFTAKGFVIGPDGKKTDITVGGRGNIDSVPVEIQKLVEAHILQDQESVEQNVGGRAIVITPDGEKQEIHFRSDEGDADFLKQLPDAVRMHVQESLGVRRIGPKDTTAKLDAIIQRLERLEKDIQQLKKALVQ